MGKGNDDGKEKYKRKSYITRDISPSRISQQLIELYKEKKALFEGLSADEQIRKLPTYQEMERDSKLCSILIEIGSKGADLITINKILPKPLTVDQPENENPWVLWHTHCFGDLERLALSPQWQTVLEKQHERGALYTKRQRGLTSAMAKLFSCLQPFDDTLYYSDHTMSMYASDLNREISIKKAEIAALIDTYLKFLAAQLSVSSYQGYDKKAYLKRPLKLSKEISRALNRKIVALVDELKRIGYSNQSAYRLTGKLLNLMYPDHYEDPDPDLVRQRYMYTTKTLKRTK